MKRQLKANGRRNPVHRAAVSCGWETGLVEEHLDAKPVKILLMCPTTVVFACKRERERESCPTRSEYTPCIVIIPD